MIFWQGRLGYLRQLGVSQYRFLSFTNCSYSTCKICLSPSQVSKSFTSITAGPSSESCHLNQVQMQMQLLVFCSLVWILLLFSGIKHTRVRQGQKKHNQHSHSKCNELEFCGLKWFIAILNSHWTRVARPCCGQGMFFEKGLVLLPQSDSVFTGFWLCSLGSWLSSEISFLFYKKQPYGS